MKEYQRELLNVAIKYFSITISIYIALNLIVSNPNQDDYINYMSEMTCNIDNASVEIVDEIESMRISRDNYFLFSIYEDKVTDENIRIIGIGNTFIPLEDLNAALTEKYN